MSAAQAVEALISEYGKLVFHTIYGLTGDWEESQDLTQETFHQALKAIDAARAKSGTQFHAKAWLLRIALNTVRMQRRRQSLFRFIPFSRMQKRDQSERIDETGSDILSESAAPVQPAGYGASDAESGNPETLIAERDAVQRTMARLSEPLRTCLMLSVVGSFSTIEIAEMLDIEEAAVRQRLARARKQFQRLYAFENGEEVVDNSQADKSAMGTINRPLRDAGKGTVDKHRNHIEHVDIEEAAVRQRLARARKQFQRLYAFENGEEVVDNSQADKSAMGTRELKDAPQAPLGPLRDAGKGNIDRHRNHIEHIGMSNERRNNTYAERFHRDPAATPFW